jgi:hypothetical protein
VVSPQNVLAAKSTDVSSPSILQRVGAAVLCSLSIVVIGTPFVDVQRTLAKSDAKPVPRVCRRRA